jgi:hypothetical protein
MGCNVNAQGQSDSKYIHAVHRFANVTQNNKIESESKVN